VRQRELHHKIILDHNRKEEERNHSRRLRAQAESQIRLLTEAEGIYEGDFYSYRYFAAEGFLPGYNFPRLPLSAYVPGRRQRKGHDEFISRPRFLAISEFGPRALIYHEGARYRVYKVNLDFGSSDLEVTHELVTATMKRCPRCGYAHVDQGPNLAEVCDRCNAALAPPTKIDNLVQLQNVSLKLAQRITCDEEERQRFGYKLVTSYRFPEVAGKPDRMDAEVYIDKTLSMHLCYGDATDLYRINLGWANQSGEQPTGFNLDLERGYWSRNQADEKDRDDAMTQGRLQRVVPFVKDTKNALVMGFEPARTGSEIASLQAAFKEAIQKHFQLEPRELSCEPMPSARERQEILFYESSEGGAGVLRQIVEDPRILPQLARQALEICHFVPGTLKDTAEHSCGKACYECLLDYGNQPDHKDLDRNLVREILAGLMRAVVVPSGGKGSRSDRMSALRKRCDSQLEKRWLDMLDELMLRPPSDAQFLIEACSTRPDFFYREYNAAVYIDGPPHDEADQIRDDEAIATRLLEMGYAVVRFHHRADWEKIFRQHADIFGTPVRPSVDEQELAVLTFKFAKPDDQPFSEQDKQQCQHEGENALHTLLNELAMPDDTKFDVRFIADGSSTYWYEYALYAIGASAGTPYVLHQVGDLLLTAGRRTPGIGKYMESTGSWLQFVAWRLTPKSPLEILRPRPGCFGQRQQLDRRFTRCRDCGFLKACEIASGAS
jgi:very-short-patch-repair endonuclease